MSVAMNAKCKRLNIFLYLSRDSFLLTHHGTAPIIALTSQFLSIKTNAKKDILYDGSYGRSVSFFQFMEVFMGNKVIIEPAATKYCCANQRFLLLQQYLGGWKGSFLLIAHSEFPMTYSFGSF